MRAVHITDLTGPDSALSLVEVDPPSVPYEVFADEESVRIDVRAAGVSFPELLQTRGQYQYQPPLPFVPGSEVAGVVVEAPPGSGLSVGDRVGAFCGSGAWAEQVLAPASLTFRLPEPISYAEGAGFAMNYHTAYFGLVTRGLFQPGERVLVHGAGGGLGSAVVDVASALGGEVVAVVSSDAKAETARACGASQVLRVESWKADLDGLFPDGVDVVLDPVGEPVTLDSLRSLREFGRYVVLGFAGGGIPTVKANRLLLRNISVVGAGWGAHAFASADYRRVASEALQPLLEQGLLHPQVGASFPLEEAARALEELESRRATGKVVLVTSHDQRQENNDGA